MIGARMWLLLMTCTDRAILAIAFHLIKFIILAVALRRTEVAYLLSVVKIDVLAAVFNLDLQQVAHNEFEEVR
ncbi:hypothetical protein GALMADRAFT_1059506 [Galerina marginata CBS 339.88]|uniref:Uncharacterized protein n=1 Tax=Galerina marginata (strain CBS 339.88) TaxID=685588 RepID=A0A067SMM8_GALM3|nr:hypothetical protein GALMADRAFT_1059506 [Galerina marginata CBS 339.88]